MLLHSQHGRHVLRNYFEKFLFTTRGLHVALMTWLGRHKAACLWSENISLLAAVWRLHAEARHQMVSTRGGANQAEIIAGHSSRTEKHTMLLLVVLSEKALFHLAQAALYKAAGMPSVQTPVAAATNENGHR